MPQRVAYQDIRHPGAVRMGCTGTFIGSCRMRFARCSVLLAAIWLMLSAPAMAQDDTSVTRLARSIKGQEQLNADLRAGMPRMQQETAGEGERLSAEEANVDGDRPLDQRPPPGPVRGRHPADAAGGHGQPGQLSSPTSCARSTPRSRCSRRCRRPRRQPRGVCGRGPAGLLQAVAGSDPGDRSTCYRQGAGEIRPGSPC